MGGDPTLIFPTGDGDWRHPCKGQGGDDHPDHDCDHDRKRDRDACDQECAPSCERLTGKVVSLRYDHFGDFTGFVLETCAGHHVVVRSEEQRIERLAREAWVTRAVVRVGLLKGDRVATLALAGHIEG